MQYKTTLKYFYDFKSPPDRFFLWWVIILTLVLLFSMVIVAFNPIPLGYTVYISGIGALIILILVFIGCVTYAYYQFKLHQNKDFLIWELKELFEENRGQIMANALYSTELQPLFDESANHILEHGSEADTIKDATIRQERYDLNDLIAQKKAYFRQFVWLCNHLDVDVVIQLDQYPVHIDEQMSD